MALKTEHEAYLRLAAHSLENSKQIAHNLNNLTSPKAYGGYVVSMIIHINLVFKTPG